MDREELARKATNVINFLTILSYPKYDPFKYLNERAVRLLGRETFGSIYNNDDIKDKDIVTRLTERVN